MSAAEIIAELPHLTPGELAQVQEKLSELIAPARVGVTTDAQTTRPARILSPRLAHPEQAKDFVKQVVELAPNAGL